MTEIQDRLMRYWKILGPGLITGAADDDPSGIATYSQTGAAYGFQLLWLTIFTFPLMGVVQEMCARIGMVTGRGLASNIRQEYSKTVLLIVVILLVAANTFNIAADIGAMAQAVQLLAPRLSFGFLVSFIVVGSIALELFITYKIYSKYLKYLAIVLLVYVATGFLIKPDWHAVMINTLVPTITFTRDQLILICAILGTTISPYLFFWQASQEIEEEIAEGRDSEAQRLDATKDEIHFMRVDVWSGMLFSNLGMFFIILTCGAVLFSHGVTNIQSASDAAEALRPIVGDWAYVLFSVGVVGVGLLSIPVLAGSSAYAIAEMMDWKEGLSKKPTQAYGFYAVIVFSMLVALLLNFIGLNPIKALIYAAVGNGVVAPIMLFFVVILSSDTSLMGAWVNGVWLKTIGWITVGVMGIVGVATIASIFI
ncbi:MAG: natural resistance-associated macrophage protein [Candidatus Kaiserbacteria bacterium]|nr:natural resistance-associated macrophage protein [Candidatus Kaiserbacteria bacterium]